MSMILVIAGLTAQAGIQAETLPGGQDPRFRSTMLDWRAPVIATGTSAVFARPLPNERYSSLFGPRYDPSRRASRLHAGLDIPSALGAPVAASSSGIVVRAGSARGYGNLVEIDHGNGVHTRYAHLSSILVDTGEQVAAGATVGLVGSTGHSTGNHLHFEVRIDGAPVDPLTALDTLALPAVAVATRPVDVHWLGWQNPLGDRLPSSTIR